MSASTLIVCACSREGVRKVGLMNRWIGQVVGLLLQNLYIRRGAMSLYIANPISYTRDRRLKTR